MARSLWAGLTEPSLESIGGAIALAVGFFVACVVLIKPTLLASGAMVTFTGDDEAALTAAAMAQPLVVPNRVDAALIGSSASREALESVFVMEQSIAAQLGLERRDVTFRTLTAGALSHMDAAILIYYLPHGFRGLVVLEISERNLGLPRDELVAPREGPRLPLASPIRDELLGQLGVEPPKRTGNVFLDYHSFFLARPLALLRVGREPVVPALHQIDAFSDPTPMQWERIVAEAASWTSRYAERAPENLALYRSLVQHLQSRSGVGVALLQATRNPTVTQRAYASPAAAAAYARYRADVEALAAELGVELWRIDEDLGIDGSNYRDGAHLVRLDARRSFSSELATRVARWCRTTSCVGAPRQLRPGQGFVQPLSPHATAGPVGPAPVKP